MRSFRRLRTGLGLGGFLLLGMVAVGVAPEFELPIEDEQMIAQAATLDLETRRYLTYLYARINKPKVALRIGHALLEENPSDRQTLLVLASLAVEQQQGEEAVRLARTFLSFYPGDHQGRYFLGAGYYLQRRFAEAEGELSELKREQFRGLKYPYETDLASSSVGAKQWYRAMLSYQELLRNHQLNDELRSEVRRELDRIYREHGPQVTADHREVRLDRSSVQRYEFTHAMHLTERHWWTVEGKRDRVEIDPVQGLRLRETSRTDYATNLRSQIGPRNISTIGLGTTPQGMSSMAELRHEFAPARSMGIAWSGNQTSTDSILLESLDGRQDKVEFTVNWLVEADLNLVMRASSRDLRVARADLGHGAGVELTLDQTLRRNGAQWLLGYRGSYASFTTTSRDVTLVDPAMQPNVPVGVRRGVLANLVAPRINRHGVGLVTTDDLTRVWGYRVELGADYDFVLDDLGYNFGMQWVFRPRKSIELGARGGYFSSARSSNAGSSAYVLDLSFRMIY